MAGETCPQCKGAGYYSLDVRVGHADFGRMMPCPCRCQQRRVAAERAGRLLDDLGTQLGALADKSIADFDPEREVGEEAVTWYGKSDKEPVIKTPEQQRQILCQAREVVYRYLRADAPTWLYLCGPNGGGKSLLAAIIANGLAKRGRSVVYRSTPRAFDWIKDGFGDGTSGARMQVLLDIDVLILDDIGAEQATEWSEARLFDIVEERSRHERTTVLTANIPLNRLSPRVASRVGGLAAVLPIIVSDARLFLRRQRFAELAAQPTLDPWDRGEGE